MPLRPAAGEHVFDGRVDEGIEARAGRLRTLLDELVANVNPPAVFVPSVHLQRDVRITRLHERIAGCAAMRAHQSRSRATARCRSACPKHADGRSAFDSVSAMISGTCSRLRSQQPQRRRLHVVSLLFLLQWRIIPPTPGLARQQTLPWYAITQKRTNRSEPNCARGV